MRDKRPVDELSIEELERILAIRKREARLARLNRMPGYDGRRVMPIQERDVSPPRHEPPEGGGPPAEPESAADAGSSPAPVAPRPPRQYYEGEPQFEDELDERLLRSPNDGRRAATWRLWWNRALTVIEIGAVIGLVALFIGLLGTLNAVNQKTAEIQAEYEATARAQIVPPTATPVINIAAVVLPSGHTFKGSEAVFNIEEVPVQYRDSYLRYAAQLQVARPTPNAEGPTRIRIPRIGVDSVVVTGDDFEALKLGVGHHIGSANPGQRGNMVLSGHNDIYGEVFRRLDDLQPGDEIIVSTRTREYTYVVEPFEERGQVKGYRIVLPTDTWVLGARGDLKQLTLVSCYPYRVDTRRIVVFATLRS